MLPGAFQFSPSKAVMVVRTGNVLNHEVAGPMPTPIRDFIAGRIGGRRAVETIATHRTFADVILPPRTRAALDEALSQVRSHELIFSRWGLGERHSSGLGLAFNFAGPPGTGKTICAEAIATVLGKKLLSVRYAEMESMWAGETPKNVAAVFRMATEEDAVLFFDEADAIASRRATGAAAEPGIDTGKRINQWQLERAMDEVVGAKSVMQQSLFGEGEQSSDDRLMRAVEAAELRWRKTAETAIVLAGLGVVLGLIAVVVALMR